jgi:hypothetical protein
MYDDSILLKFKRDFTSDEAVNFLLKKVSELQIEIGMLKSELAEKVFECNNLRNATVTEGTKTKKAWLKDDLINLIDGELKTQKSINKVIEKQAIEWRDKFFSLQAKVQLVELKGE